MRPGKTVVRTNGKPGSWNRASRVLAMAIVCVGSLTATKAENSRGWCPEDSVCRDELPRLFDTYETSYLRFEEHYAGRNLYAELPFRNLTESEFEAGRYFARFESVDGRVVLCGFDAWQEAALDELAGVAVGDDVLVHGKIVDMQPGGGLTVDACVLVKL